MSKVIAGKIVLLIVGVLLSVQLLFYNGVRVGNIARSKNEGARLVQEIEELSVTKNELQQYLGQLQKEYNEVAASVPPGFLKGYEDLEVVLAGFLDYLKAPELERMGATVSIQGAREYTLKPLPFYEHDLSITFSFTRLTDARELLSYILDQADYPLIVRNFELRSSGEQEISGTLQLSLLIPVRQEKPFFGMKEEGR